MPSLVRLTIAGLAGVATGIAFEPFGAVYLLPVAIAALALACRGIRLRTGFAAGAVFGTAFMLVLLPWLQVIGADAWVLLSVVQGLFYGLLGAGTVVLTRNRWWPLLVPALWVGTETLRGTVPFGGFPWGRLAYATVDTPAADLYPLLGSAGVSFVVALSGTLLAWAALNLRRAPYPAIGVVGAMVLAAFAAGALTVPPSVPADAPRVQVAAVQGNVPGEGMSAFAERRVVLNNHVQATRDFAGDVVGTERQPDLVIWPENSTDIDPFSDPTVYADIQSAVDAVGVPVLVGAMVGGEEPGDVFNQGIVWQPGSGPADRYSKTHPVPFGEYIPFRDQIARFVTRLDQIPRDMVPGSEPGLLPMAGTVIGDVICFEVAYDEVVHDVIDGGAELLVVQTNNATYMGTGQIEQQFAISRLRALETQRYVVVAATNGVSGIIGPSGEVVQRAPTRATAVLEQTVPVLQTLTPAVRFGGLVEAGISLIGAGAVLAGLVIQYRARRRPVPERPERSEPERTRIGGA